MKLLNVLGATVLAVFAHVAAAHEVVYSATLSGAAEATPNDSPGSGTVLVTVDVDLITMRIQASFADLVAATTAAHIHCCTSVPLTGAAGVATQTPSFTGFPLGVTSGTFDQTLDLTLASSYNGSFITASGGTVSVAFNALVRGLDAGNAYFNIHTSEFPVGEIRGFLAPVAVPIPEPQIYFLMLGGLAVVAANVRRKRHT